MSARELHERFDAVLPRSAAWPSRPGQHASTLAVLDAQQPVPRTQAHTSLPWGQTPPDDFVGTVRRPGGRLEVWRYGQRSGAARGVAA